MDLLSPQVERLIGGNINRRTVENVAVASFLYTDLAENMSVGGVLKFVVTQNRLIPDQSSIRMQLAIWSQLVRCNCPQFCCSVLPEASHAIIPPSRFHTSV